jgi:small subunit ribosomal protein S6e
MLFALISVQLYIFSLILVCRLVTPLTLQRKRRRESIKKRSLEKSKADAAEYHKLLVQRLKEQRERR